MFKFFNRIIGIYYMFMNNIKDWILIWGDC